MTEEFEPTESVSEIIMAKKLRLEVSADGENYTRIEDKQLMDLIQHMFERMFFDP